MLLPHDGYVCYYLKCDSGVTKRGNVVVKSHVKRAMLIINTNHESMYYNINHINHITHVIKHKHVFEVVSNTNMYLKQFVVKDEMQHVFLKNVVGVC